MEQGKCGVEHAILPEMGIVVAGECIIGADSHTCSYGALGAFSTGVGTTDIATGMATGELWFKVPEAIKFVLTGKPSKYVSGKDIILHIINEIGVDGALYKSMEFVGDGIQYLTMDDRFTICNMAIEAGAKNGIFPVDDQTIDVYKRQVQDSNTIYTMSLNGKKVKKLYTMDMTGEIVFEVVGDKVLILARGMGDSSITYEMISLDGKRQLLDTNDVSDGIDVYKRQALCYL